MKNKLLAVLTASLLIAPLLAGCNSSSNEEKGSSSEPVAPASSSASQQESNTKDEPFPLSGKTKRYSFAESGYLVNARFALNTDGVLGKEKDAFSVKWTEDNWNFQNDLSDDNASYARMVVDAPFSGNYPFKVYASNFNQNYPYRIYTNATDTSGAYQEVSISDPAYVWQSEERSSGSFNLHLNKGKNVLNFQVIRWGAARGVAMPEELTVLRSRGNGSDTGSYSSDDFIWQCARLASGVNVLNPDEAIRYGPLQEDPDPSFEQGFILDFTPDSADQSLDISYKLLAKNSGSAAIRLRLGNSASNAYEADVSDSPLNSVQVAHIPSYALKEMGYQPGNKMHIQVACAKGSMELLGLETSDVTDKNDKLVLNAADIKSKTLVRGRNIDDNNYVGLDWSSSGIEFEITGGGDIYANMEEVNDAFGHKGSAAGGTRFAVEIDGQFRGNVSPTSNTRIATGLSEAKHKVAIYKTSEAAGGLVNLKSLSVKEGVTINKTSKDYRFEILGDSITCGNQVSATEENGYQSYATQLSNSYNANLNVVAVSGRGLKVGYNSEVNWAASSENEINSLWTKTSYFRNKTRSWNPSNYVPDVVVCNLGNNDLGDHIMSVIPMTIKEFTDEVVSFSGKLREAYPSAKIVWTYGAYINRKYESQYRAAVEGIGDSNIKFVYLNQMGGGADGHPNVAQHLIIADRLSSVVATMLGVNDPRGK